MAENNASKWGFWLSVNDEDSARYAAKMSGLPVFLLGLTSLIAAAALFNLQGPIIAGVNIAIGLFLFVAGLRIRSGQFGTLPFAVGIWLVNTILAVSLLGVHASSVMSILIGLLAVSGLRGWFWLRKNDQV